MTLEERVEKLESKLVSARRINRLMLFFGIGLVLIVWFFASGTLTAQDRVQDEIRARKFIVEDENGNVRVLITLGDDEIGPGWAIFDENNLNRAQFSVSEEGPVFRMFDKNGNVRLKQSVNDSESSLSLWDENMNRSIVQSVGADYSGFSLFDGNAIPRVFIGITEDDIPCLGMTDDNGKVRTELRVNEKWPSLAMFDENRIACLELKVLENGSYLNMYDTYESIRAMMGVDNNRPFLQFYDNARPHQLLWSAP